MAGGPDFDVAIVSAGATLAQPAGERVFFPSEACSKDRFGSPMRLRDVMSAAERIKRSWRQRHDFAKKLSSLVRSIIGEIEKCAASCGKLSVVVAA